RPASDRLRWIQELLDELARRIDAAGEVGACKEQAFAGYEDGLGVPFQQVPNVLMLWVRTRSASQGSGQEAQHTNAIHEIVNLRDRQPMPFYRLLLAENPSVFAEQVIAEQQAVRVQENSLERFRGH
ncbi:MAG: hypothetical protein WBO97_04155, partial [Tepidiformaceae bacterium]